MLDISYVDITKPIYMPKNSAKYYGLPRWPSINEYCNPKRDVEPGILFTEHSRYKSIKAGLLGIQPWQETDMYKKAVDKIKKGRTAWKTSSIEELDERFESLHKLYSSIKNHGYLSQNQIINCDVPSRSCKTIKSIYINSLRRFSGMIS